MFSFCFSFILLLTLCSLLTLFHFFRFFGSFGFQLRYVQYYGPDFMFLVFPSYILFLTFCSQHLYFVLLGLLVLLCNLRYGFFYFRLLITCKFYSLLTLFHLLFYGFGFTWFPSLIALFTFFFNISRFLSHFFVTFSFLILFFISL